MYIGDVGEKTRAYALKNAVAHDGVAMQGPVISSLFVEGLDRKDMSKYGKIIADMIAVVNKMSQEQQKIEFEKVKDLVSEREIREGLQELPDAENGVVMRFRPAPSGPMHVGHIISNILSSLYVKKYGGKFYVIFDDTDPDAVLKDAYENLKTDCDWVFENVTEYLNASDRMQIYYKYAEELIKKSEAYVCTCLSVDFKQFSEAQKECPCRKFSVKENLERWSLMLSKTGFKSGEAVLRFKSGMSNPNPALRDFPLARINETPHPKQKKKYRVWPLMNLAVSADDIELGMTHIIRGKDHMDNAKRQKMIFDVFGKKYPWTSFIGRVKFTDLVLSKRKITAMIESGEFSGYEDERLPTVASLRKRGFNREIFEKFAEQRGLTEVDKVISAKDFFDALDNLSD